MKHNNEETIQNGTPFTEIEYTPIRRKSSENRTVCVTEDEISVALPEAPSSPSQMHEQESSHTTTLPTEEPKEETFEEMETSETLSLPEEREETSQEILDEEASENTEEGVEEATEESAQEIACDLSSSSQNAPHFERVILPDEISLADVLPLVSSQATTDVPLASEETDAIEDSQSLEQSETPEQEPTAEDEEEFVFTPMPKPIEYERVVLPDEISLVDVLTEIRPSSAEGEQTPTDVDGACAEERVENADALPLIEEEFVFLDEPIEDGAIEEHTSSEDITQSEEEAVSEETAPVEEDAPHEEDDSPKEDTPIAIPDIYREEEIPPQMPDTLVVDEEISQEEDTTEDDAIVQDDSPSQDVEETEEEPVVENPKKKKAEPKERPIEGRFDMIELFAFTLAFVLLLTTFFFRSSAVVGSSMESTLHDGDQLILYSFMYEPKVGDIIVFEDYSTGYREPLVKRVIATEGQKIEIYDAYTVLIDGKKLEEDYIFLDGPDLTDYPIIHTVEEGHIFVMGDHRNGSSDSRKFRDVSVETVLGKVLFRYYPFDTFKKFD